MKYVVLGEFSVFSFTVWLDRPCSWGKTCQSLACFKYLSRSARCRSTVPGCPVRSHTVWRWNRAEYNQGYTRIAPTSPLQSHCRGASQNAAQALSCTVWSWSSGQLQEKKQHLKRSSVAYDQKGYYTQHYQNCISAWSMAKCWVHFQFMSCYTLTTLKRLFK